MTMTDRLKQTFPTKDDLAATPPPAHLHQRETLVNGVLENWSGDTGSWSIRW